MASTKKSVEKSAQKSSQKSAPTLAPKNLRKPTRRTLALIAHDGKKAQMVGFVKDNFSALQKFELVATATTGRLVAEAGLKVRKMLSGPIGGDAQIAALAATGECQGVIFLRDPLGMHPHDPDISSLLRICDVHNVPLATNLATAQLLIQCLS